MSLKSRSTVSVLFAPVLVVLTFLGFLSSLIGSIFLAFVLLESTFLEDFFTSATIDLAGFAVLTATGEISGA
jgi:hypothetical protein